jgi:hypothetical protein
MMISAVVFKPGSAGRPVTRLTRSWNWAGLKKNMGKKNPMWPSGLTRQDPVKKTGCNPLIFVFYFTCSFDFKKKNKLTRTTQ